MTEPIALRIAPGLELWPVDPRAIGSNPLRCHALVELHDDSPQYAPWEFDADGYLTTADVADGGYPMPDGCWRNVGRRAPCGDPTASDLGLCPAHLAELRDQETAR